MQCLKHFTVKFFFTSGGNEEAGALEVSSSASRSVEVAVRKQWGDIRSDVIESNQGVNEVIKQVNQWGY